MRRILPGQIFCLLAAALAARVRAEEAPAATAPAEGPDAEEQLDEGLKRFGYLAGLSRGRVTDEQRTALEREAIDLHAGIARLLGTDRAFLFGTGFGHGTAVVLDLKECEEVIAAYDKRVEAFRARSQGANP
jgi:hypothetical protein